LKKNNLIDELQNIDDETIDKVLKIKNKDDLRKEQMKEKSKKNLKWFGILVPALCLILVGVFAINSFNKDERVKIASPLTEVNSLSEMKKYLGFEVPVLKTKAIKSYIVIGDVSEKYAYHGRIVYEDGSGFEIEKSDSDVSGIYGGEKEKEQDINNIHVTIYTYEDVRYAVWTHKGFSYSYSSSVNDNNFADDLESIVSLTSI